MTDQMATAVFHKDFPYTSRRRNAGWHVKAGPDAQTLPEEVIAAAEAAGVAERVPAKPKTARRSQPKGGAVPSQPEQE